MSFTTHTHACTHTHTSFQLILMMGNYMNAGSRNQQSYGFELSYLTKVGLVSTSD